MLPNRFTFLLLIVLFVGWMSNCKAAKVDTVVIPSSVMGRDIKAVVITPQLYTASQLFPVVYLLHGYSGNYSDWITNTQNLSSQADLYQMILVCPDGGYDSWYFDSPIMRNSQYETYISQEVIDWVDKNYATVSKPKGRAIAGLSMGGHGALYLAFKHPDIFGAAGSMSGGVDIRPFSDKWGIEDRLGDCSTHAQSFEENTIVNMLHLLNIHELALIIDCGREDFFYEVNVDLHRSLTEKNIPHDFISRPGGHTWAYWGGAIPYQLLFFNQYFQE